MKGHRLTLHSSPETDYLIRKFYRPHVSIEQTAAISTVQMFPARLFHR